MKPALILLHLEPNLLIENIQKINILFVSNNMHSMCAPAPAILQGANAWKLSVF